MYSISSNAGDVFNMNICTYVTAVSMQPKKMVVAIYKNTKTLELVNKNRQFVLQLLAAGQYRLVDILGKKSGHTIDKISRLEKRNLLTEWNGYKILKEALAVMELVVTGTMPGGDHKIFLCDMVRYKNLQDGNPLGLNELRKHKLIHI